MAYLPHGQIEHGTLVVGYFDKDKIVVAADSQTLLTETGSEKKEYKYGCKIATLSNRLLYTQTGLTGHRRGPSSPIQDWTAMGEAKRVFSEHPTDPPNALSGYWARAMVDHFNRVLQFPEGRKEIEYAAVSQDGVVINGLFLYAPLDGELQAVAAQITYRGLLAPIVAADFFNVFGPYFAFGHTEGAEEYLRLKSDRARQEIDDWNQKQQSLHGDREAFSVKRLVELAIDHDQTRTIGGEVDVAILRKNGTVEWAANPNCK